MKPAAKIISFIIVTLIYCHLNSCNHKPDFDLFLIKVDSIHLPTSISANIPFDIDFYGIIGRNGCCSFSNFNQSLTDNDIDIEAWGKLDAQALICPTWIVPLNGNKVSMTIPTSGIYTIKIKQPDKTFLERQITVN